MILTNFISGSPKGGVTDVHSVLNLCTMVAEPLVIANYTCTSCTSWPLIFPALATELSGKLENWSVRFLGVAWYCNFPQNICQEFLLSCSDFLRGGGSGAVRISVPQRSQGFIVLCKPKQKKIYWFWWGEKYFFRPYFIKHKDAKRHTFETDVKNLFLHVKQQ